MVKPIINDSLQVTAGSRGCHFIRYIHPHTHSFLHGTWSCTCGSVWPLEVRREYPDLEVDANSVTMAAYGYKSSWTVGKEAKNLMQAAAMAQVVLKAGRVQFMKMDKCKR